jgi:hypothetical protein
LPERFVAVDAGAALAGRPLVVLRYLDVVLVVLVVGPAIALGAPVLGTVLAAVGWVGQRVLEKVDKRWTRKVAEPVKAFGITLFEAFGRIWLLAGVIIISGVVGGRRDGLTSALIIFGAYTVAFAIKVFSGPPQRRSAR